MVSPNNPLSTPNTPGKIKEPPPPVPEYILHPSPETPPSTEPSPKPKKAKEGEGQEKEDIEGKEYQKSTDDGVGKEDIEMPQPEPVPEYTDPAP